MLQLEDTLDNLRGICRLLNLHRAIVLTDDRLLLSEITNTLKNQVGTNHGGIQCIAAQLVAHFKDGAGGYYLYPTNAKDCGQEYDYEIIEELDGEIKLKVIEVGYMNNKGKYCKGRRTLFYDSPKVYDTWLKFHED